MFKIRPLLVAAAISAVAGLAYADSPHFVNANGAVSQSTGDLVVSFKEAGLGSFVTIDYTLSTTSEQFTWQCFTKSGNKPQGSPQGPFTVAGQSTNASFSSGKAGNITGSVSLPPSQATASCTGGGLKLCLIDAEYNGVTFADVTNNIVAISNENFGGTIQGPSKSNPGVCLQ
jgi:hypothetical protein